MSEDSPGQGKNARKSPENRNSLPTYETSIKPRKPGERQRLVMPAHLRGAKDVDVPGRKRFLWQLRNVLDRLKEQ